jgi:acyl-CoA synthetase (AMP-forming)/AMP-acid ligase II
MAETVTAADLLVIMFTPGSSRTLARHARTAGADLCALHAGSLPPVLPPGQPAQPGARATLFGMTEAFGPYRGFPADTDMPAAAWGSRGKPFPGMEVRIVDPDGQPVAVGTGGMIQIRGPHTAGICGRSRALRSIDGVDSAWVTNVPGTAGERVGAAVVQSSRARDGEQLRDRSRKLLSTFKVPTVWLLLKSDNDVPRASTGKVDIRRLREMLIEAGVQRSR